MTRSISFTDKKQGRWVRKWEVQSRSNPDQDPYTVSLSEAGTYGCSCPRWKFCKAPKTDCGHIIFVKLGTFGESTPMTRTAPSEVFTEPTGSQFTLKRAISFD